MIIRYIISMLFVISCNQGTQKQNNSSYENRKSNDSEPSVSNASSPESSSENQSIEITEEPTEDSYLALILPQSEDGDQNFEENIPFIFSIKC